MTKPFKVDFMIVGAQKCGTTSLGRMFRTHPSVVCSRKKEPHFFSTCTDWRAELPRYEELFERRPGAIYFEASTSYTFYPHRKLELWADLHAYNPDLKIIYLVRDPIERITSGYMHHYQRGYTDFDLDRAVVEDPIFLDVTRYATQIRPFVSHFGAERVRILFFDDLLRDPNGLVRDLAGFLGIDPNKFGDTGSIHINKSVGGRKRHYKWDAPGILLRQVRRFTPFLWRIITDNSARAFDRKPQMSGQVRQRLLQKLEPEINELEEITGRDLAHWRRVG
jgi:hypothetical protein